MRSLTPLSRAGREVLDAGHLRSALRPSPADATVAAALRCGTAVAVSMLACAAVGRRDLAGFAALAALTSLYGRYDPYRRRASLLVLVGLVLVGTIALMSSLVVLGAPAVARPLALGLLAAGANALFVLVRSGPPGATIVAFAAGSGLAGDPTWGDVLARSVAGLVAVAIAWFVCCGGYLLRPDGPARLAVRRAADATTAAMSDGAHVPRALAAIERARGVLADDASHARTARSAHSLAAQVDTLAATLGQPPRVLPPRLTLRGTISSSATTLRSRAGTARIGIASALAAWLAQTVGFGHPAWAATGATAVLQGPTPANVVVRGIQRAGGTAVGAVLAWWLLALHPSFWVTAAIVVALQVVTEVIVGRHYGLAMLTITPMALLMTSLAMDADPARLALERATDTVIGTVVALGVLVLLTDHHQRRSSGRPAPG